MKRSVLVLGASLVLAAGAGALTAIAVGQGQAPRPVRTVTISVSDGARGPAGPAGPQGPKGDPGTTVCPEGSVFGKLVINSPGGHAEIFTCIVGP